MREDTVRSATRRGERANTTLHCRGGLSPLCLPGLSGPLYRMCLRTTLLRREGFIHCLPRPPPLAQACGRVCPVHGRKAWSGHSPSWGWIQDKRAEEGHVTSEPHPRKGQKGDPKEVIHSNYPDSPSRAVYTKACVCLRFWEAGLLGERGKAPAVLLHVVRSCYDAVVPFGISQQLSELLLPHSLANRVCGRPLCVC